jgi:hypothetical protein
LWVVGGDAISVLFHASLDCYAGFPNVGGLSRAGAGNLINSLSISWWRMSLIVLADDVPKFWARSKEQFAVVPSEYALELVSD